MARLTKEKAKNSRLQIRVDESTLNKIQQAAQYSGKTTSEFVMEHSLNAAETIISQHTQITLADADWEDFYQALVNPPAPNQALKQAFAAYQKGLLNE